MYVLEKHTPVLRRYTVKCVSVLLWTDISEFAPAASRAMLHRGPEVQLPGSSLRRSRDLIGHLHKLCCPCADVKSERVHLAVAVMFAQSCKLLYWTPNA